MTRKALIGLACLLLACPAFAGTKGKKLIEYGWDVPDTQYVREHIQDMEKMPFDGVVIHIGPRESKAKRESLSWSCWSSKQCQPEDYEFAIEDLKATKFQRFTDNFIQSETCPGTVDWFDPAWSSVAHNFACLARVAKQGGCKGIMFDPELYVSYPVWSYDRLPQELKSAHTLLEYRAKARERGREFIRAINNEFPNITILTLFGYSLTYHATNVWAHRTLDTVPDVLQTDFYDGILEAADSGTTFVDGYEFSYGYRDRSNFAWGRKVMLEDAMANCGSKKAFAKHVRAGFGLWVDFNSASLGFHQDDTSKNFFTPAGFRASVNYALDNCDKYVWIYSERTHWWGDAPPAPYVEAMRLAREGPGPGEPHPFYESPIRAAILHQHPDSWCFADLRKTMTEVLDLPKDGWKFRFDESGIGFGDKWYSETLDDSDWLTLSIGRFWEEQLGDYDGIGWYRRRFTAPKIEPGKKVFLGFGGVADGARVWLNGKFVGQHDTEWKDPFALEITDQLRSGTDNALAVEVTDHGGTGGLWTSIKLMQK